MGKYLLYGLLVVGASSAANWIGLVERTGVPTGGYGGTRGGWVGGSGGWSSSGSGHK